jgi:hypothetical protein
MFGPPEKVWVDKVESKVPGLILADHGKGKVGWIPWDVGGLYYRHSSQGHGGLMTDIIDHLLPEGRQLISSAHPLVEITLMRQPKRNRTLVHFVNVTGHSGTAYFAPVEMSQIKVQVALEFSSARALGLGEKLPVRADGSYREFTLPKLEAYEVVVLE